jgi:DNA-binding transcriptional LysR family regulator
MLSRYPDIDITLTEAEPPEALELVQAADVDVALVFGYDGRPVAGAGLRWLRLADEPVHLVLPPGHRLVDRSPIATGDLAEEPWIMGCVRCREHAVALCAAAGFEPRVRHVSDDYLVVQNLVAVGLGVTLLPNSALEAYRHPEVVVRPSPTWGTRTYGVVHRDGADAVPATAAFLQLLSGIA